MKILPVNKPEINLNKFKIDLNSMSLMDLKEECKKRGLSGYSSLNKTELIGLLTNQKE
ncbi:MAG: Rho termination factor N-terminal domain-containing protein [Clostridium sp.]